MECCCWCFTFLLSFSLQALCLPLLTLSVSLSSLSLSPAHSHIALHTHGLYPLFNFFIAFSYLKSKYYPTKKTLFSYVVVNVFHNEAINNGPNGCRSINDHNRFSKEHVRPPPTLDSSEAWARMDADICSGQCADACV